MAKKKQELTYEQENQYNALKDKYLDGIFDEKIQSTLIEKIDSYVEDKFIHLLKLEALESALETDLEGVAELKITHGEFSENYYPLSILELFNKQLIPQPKNIADKRLLYYLNEIDFNEKKIKPSFRKKTKKLYPKSTITYLEDICNTIEYIQLEDKKNEQYYEWINYIGEYILYGEEETIKIINTSNINIDEELFQNIETKIDKNLNSYSNHFIHKLKFATKKINKNLKELKITTRDIYSKREENLRQSILNSISQLESEEYIQKINPNVLNYQLFNAIEMYCELEYLNKKYSYRNKNNLFQQEYTLYNTLKKISGTIPKTNKEETLKKLKLLAHMDSWRNIN